MSYEQIRAYCLNKPGAEETWPFGPEPTVFKVKEKMFALSHAHEEPTRINLKCEPELAELLRSEYTAVKPGYHMNKRHWNTITVGADLSFEMIQDQIDRSYNLVVKGLKKADRQALTES